MTSNSGEKYCFIHIPKTAGTSFRVMLDGYFSGEKMFPTREMMKSHHQNGYPGWKAYFKLSEEQEKAVQIYVGHITYAVAKDLVKPSHLLTFLREPEARFKSHVNYIHKTWIRQGRTKELDETYAKLERTLYNRQVAQLSDTQKEKLHYQNKQLQIDDNALAQAKENLASCGVIGISERFTESVYWVEKQYGWRLGRIRKVNRTSVMPQKELPEFILQDMKKSIEYDNELYRFGCELFEERNKIKKTYVFLRNWRMV